MQMATATKQWTLEELHSLPDDGSKYELIHGELFVTPPPTDNHETILARLSRVLDPYVAEQRLGFVYHPRAVVRFEGSEVEPDLMVRLPQADRKADWKGAPLPILVVEVLSPYTRRRDRMQKLDFYMEIGIAEYWILDPERESITIVRRGDEPREEMEQVVWEPSGATAALSVSVSSLFV